MDDMVILEIWCASIIAGMVLTMLMPKIFADSPVDEVRQGKAACVPSEEILHLEELQEHRASMVLVQEEACSSELMPRAGLYL